MRSVETLVGGEWVASGEWIDVQNPADLRTPAFRVPALTPDDVTGAYDHAQRAFATWRRTSPLERATILTTAAGLLRERADTIAEDIATENGKTRAEARGETLKAADFLEYYGLLVGRGGYGTLLSDIRPDTRTSAQREPLGVVLAITPWNDPLITPARKLAPALAAGNTAVLKPATETPVSGLHLARALHGAGLPAGVLGVVTGHTPRIGEALLGDERIAAVTFTGSNAVGDRLRTAFAARNIRFQGELGGKNASAVLADADLPKAARTVVAAAFGQAGQRCTATSRVIVERSAYEEFTRLLLAEVAGLRLGAPLAEGTGMGPLSSARQRDGVVAHIEGAVAQGATVLAGGDVPAEGDLAHGCYVAPTVLADVTADMAIWREEVFGPVIALRAVDSFDEAVAAVNDSDFGLAAAVFTRDLGAAHRFADEAECGQIAVNLTTPGWDVHHPFGGFHDSGSPFKEQGTEALHFYTRVKTVAIHFGA
ncbi:aldehyde dehydrogenase family protein [Streptomyces sp. S465]|uniref:aldehyde dehydrogenase family protein n=1 Tax=Streptomyces sp. S465 TaxID=2979468 RepID=UPI0022A886C6|nr:aldehyde dehydrogenase family protein [Streptomyces sp. S465]WAP60019.1 aldehyde dehydrogenase family protein [Streptomyces sp. S465]